MYTFNQVDSSCTIQERTREIPVLFCSVFLLESKGSASIKLSFSHFLLVSLFSAYQSMILNFFRSFINTRDCIYLYTIYLYKYIYL